MKKILAFLLVLSLALFTACAKTKEFHTKLQLEYLNGDYTLATQFATGKEELSKPLPITLKWSGRGEKIIAIKEVETGDMIRYKVDSNSLDVYNLKVHTEYEWLVDGVSKGTFTTASGIRNMYIDGITNVRDIGGYEIEDGYVNQGLLIRCSKLTDDDTGEVLITEDGIEAFRMLGIKTELDLRKIEPDKDGLIEQGGITASAVPGVNYISFPMDSGGNYLLRNRKLLPDLFKILANEDNYPIIFHCSIGTDRTGAVAFIINALLGVSREDIYRDYLFSNFGYIHGMRHPTTIDDYIMRVTINEEASLQENVRAYLISQGVEEADIDAFINIMTK